MGDESITGPVPDGWEVTTLGEIVERGSGHVQTGPFGSQLHASDYVPVGVPSIMPVNIGDNQIIEEGIARITEDDAERLSRHRVQAGDIVYSRRGDVERRALIRPEQAGWLCGTGCLKVRLGNAGVDPKFVSYYLGHPEVRAWILRHAVGATMPNLNTSIMEAIPLLVPPPEEQQAIARILGTLDDKIELNRRMNETLEGMARAIFKSWFVDFLPVRAKQRARTCLRAARKQAQTGDPVRAKAAGQQPSLSAVPSACASHADRGTAQAGGLTPHIADLFPDEFVESELGEIPRGWEVTGLNAVATLRKESAKPMQASARLWEHYSIPAFDAGRAPVVEAGATIKSGKYRVPPTSVLVSKLNPQFLRVWLPDVQDEAAAICSTEFMPFIPLHDTWRPFLYELMKSDAIQQGIHERVTGSTGSRQRAKPEDVAAMYVIVPNAELIETFGRTVGPLHEKMLTCISESRTLAALRDTLLPKLISGELRVPDAERIVESGHGMPCPDDAGPDDAGPDDAGPDDAGPDDADYIVGRCV